MRSRRNRPGDIPLNVVEYTKDRRLKPWRKEAGISPISLFRCHIWTGLIRDAGVPTLSAIIRGELFDEDL